MPLIYLNYAMLLVAIVCMFTGFVYMMFNSNPYPEQANTIYRAGFFLTIIFVCSIVFALGGILAFLRSKRGYKPAAVEDANK